MATPLVGEGDAVGRELLAIEVVFRLFELQILVLGGSLSPEVNLRGSGRHAAAYRLRHRPASRSSCSTSTRPTRRLRRMQSDSTGNPPSSRRARPWNVSATVSTAGIVTAGHKPAGRATIALVPSWTRETHSQCKHSSCN